MLDANKNGRADRLGRPTRLRSGTEQPDGRYPFTVTGYRIRTVGAARARTLVIVLVEKKQPDPDHPLAVRYRHSKRTNRSSVPPAARSSGGREPLPLDATATGNNTAGNDDTCRDREHDTPTTTTPTTLTDSDHDGAPDPQDCAPHAPTSPRRGRSTDPPSSTPTATGSTAPNPTRSSSPPPATTPSGTKTRPKHSIQAAITTASPATGATSVSTGDLHRL